MTHEYTLLVGGTVVPGGDEPDVSAIAWAGDTILALGTDRDVRAISRGDSHVIDLRGATVVPLAPDAGVTWPVDARLEVGGAADLAVLDRDPRTVPAGAERDVRARVRALVRGGRVLSGSLAGEQARAARPAAGLLDVDAPGRQDGRAGERAGVASVPDRRADQVGYGVLSRERGGRESMRMADLKAGWAIVGNDGQRFGTVKSVGQNYLLVSTPGLGGNRYVPASHIANVEHEVVYLNLAKREADEMGWEQPPRDRDAPDPPQETDLHRHV